MSGTLYTWAGNTNAAAVQAAAALAGNSVKVGDFVPGTAPEGFPAHSSAPVFSTACGQKLTQLSAMLAHVSGGASHEQLEWIGFAENVLTPSAAGWVFPTLGAMPNNKGAIAEAKKALQCALAYLNDVLASKTFLAGERASAADAACVAALSLAFKQVLAPECRKSIPHVTRWFQTCVHKMSAFGEHKLCEKEAQFDGKVFGELNKKSGGDNKKAAKPKKEAAPKKEAPKKAEAAGDAVADIEAAKKAKDPWYGLPGTYDFDAWKRCYSNNDTIPTAMNYFWEKLDKENYSCWFGKYKYGDEIAMPFMASNLIRGFYQRIEKMRKNSFANVCVFGGKEKGDIEISGVWFWKGQGLAFELCNDWQTDFDTYDWKKLDLDSAADKKMITEYFAWEGDFDGKSFYEGKTWK